VSPPREITLGIPKGSLQQSTLGIFERVGLQFTAASRTLWLSSNDPEIVPVLLKPQEIPIYVKSGRLDAGLSGRDWIVEQDVLQHVAVKAELPFSRQTSRPIRWVLAVPEASPIRTVDDLRTECDARRLDGDPFVISTELTRISQMWLARAGVDALVEFSWGATEAKAEYFADAIIEGTETGASLRANHLREIAEVFTSTNQFFVNRRIYREDSWKHDKLDAVSHLIRGALRANDFVELRVISEKSLELASLLGVDAQLVAVSEVAGGRGFSATVTLPRTRVPYALPAVVAAGASDAWVTAMSIYYSQDADSSLRAETEARNASARMPLAPPAPLAE
jgi:ATP phosphoribosyltransferase